MGTPVAMHIPTHLIEEELKKQGRSAEAQKILGELPAKIDHDQHAQQLQKLGLDPGKLAESAVAKGIASL
jgi:hypothetical protein